MQYELTELTSTITNLDISLGDTLFVHSALNAFGFPKKTTKKQMNKKIFEQLKFMVGDYGNIAVPTFNFGFCNGEPYDINETASKGMGMFSEYVRTLKDSVRSKHPIQSFSIIGKKAKDICSSDTYSAFGKDSSFSKLIELDPKILLIGATIQSVSFIHISEERNKVPYRHFKDFKGFYRDSCGITTNRAYGMFVRDLEKNQLLKINKVERILTDRKLIQKKDFSSGKLSLFRSSDFLAIVDEKLEQSSSWLIED